MLRRDGADTRAAVVALAILLAIACGSCGSPTAGQSSPTGAVQGASAGEPSASAVKSFQVTTPDGQVSLALDGKLPPSWPTNFPLPPGATVAGSGSLGGSGATQMVGVFTTPLSPQDAFAYYHVPQTGLTTTDAKTVGVGATYLGSMRVIAPYMGSVTVTGRTGATYVVIVLKGVPG